MYKLLLVTNERAVLDMFSRLGNLHEMGYLPLAVVPGLAQAIDYMAGEPVDAVGYALSKYEARDMYSYLIKARPSLPIFHVVHDEAVQRETLADLKKVLDRMHEDYSDDGYNEDAMLDILRQELARDILSGLVESSRALHERMMMVRSRVDTQAPCLVADIDLPQGEVYLQDRWRYGSERLQSAMRNNFFGKITDNVLYHVAVLTPRRIRLLACQATDTATSDGQAFARGAREHIEKTVERIKDFLDLDMDIQEFTLIDSLDALTKERSQ